MHTDRQAHTHKSPKVTFHKKSTIERFLEGCGEEGRAWCTGKTQRDRVEREVGGGTGMGNTCKSMANLFQCMTKTTAML